MEKLPEGWDYKRLEVVVTIHDNLRVPVKKRDRKPGPISYCGANGIIDHVNGFTHEGDFILLAEDGGYFGPNEKSAYRMLGKFWANNHVHILQGKEGILDNGWLKYALVGIDLGNYLTGATRPKLTQSAMRKIMLPLPPLAEQRRIVARIEELVGRVEEARRLQSAAQKELAAIGPAILDRAFKGEI